MAGAPSHGDPLPMARPSISIVCGLAGTPASAEIARIGSTLAELLEARLELVHVVERPAGSSALNARAMLDGLADASASQFVGRHLVPFGDPAAQLASIAVECAARLIVVGARSSASTRQARIGRVARALAADAPCPVLVIPEGLERHVRPRTWRDRSIVCGFDGSPSSLNAAVHASVLATALSAEVNLVTVDAVYPTGGANLMDRIVRALDAHPELADRRRGLAINRQLHSGEPAWELERVAATATAPFIAIGSRGAHRSRQGSLGVVATHLLRTSTRPLLIVPPAPLDGSRQEAAHAHRPRSLDDPAVPAVAGSA